MLFVAIFVIPFLDFLPIIPGTAITLFPVLGAPLSCIGLLCLKKRSGNVFVEGIIAVTLFLLSFFSLISQRQESHSWIAFLLIIPFFLFSFRFFSLGERQRELFVVVMLISLLPHLYFSGGDSSISSLTVSREIGAHRDANFAALQISWGVIACLGMALSRNISHLKKIFFIVGGIIAGGVLISTASRGGVLGTTVALGGVFLYRFQNKGARFAIVLFAVLGIGFLIGGGLDALAQGANQETALGRFLARCTGDELSDGSGRVEMWMWTLKRLFVTGEGFFIPMGSNSVFEVFGVYVHNTYLDMMLSLGVLISSPFFLLLLKAVFKNFRNLTLEKESWTELVILFCAFSTLIQISFLTALSNKLTWVAIAITLALAFQKKVPFKRS